MIISKQVEGWGNVWYDDNNADNENMFKSAVTALTPLKSAAVEEEEEEEESAFITLRKMMFGDG